MLTDRLSDLTPDDYRKLFPALCDNDLTPAEKHKLFWALHKFALERAAAAARRSVSDFVLERTLAGLAQRHSFILNHGHWAALVVALYAPSRPLPRMERLLKEPAFFDGGQSNEPLRRIEKLRPDHSIEGFDCGKPEWNLLLWNTWTNQQALSRYGDQAPQTYIGLSGDTVVGYYTLAGGVVCCEPERTREGPTARLPQFTVSIMLLAPLAVDKRWHGQGAGKALLKDAMLRTLQPTSILNVPGWGAPAFLAVHAKDPDAVEFYRQFDFIPSPTDRTHLFVRLKDVRRMISKP